MISVCIIVLRYPGRLQREQGNMGNMTYFAVVFATVWRSGRYSDTQIHTSPGVQETRLCYA